MNHPEEHETAGSSLEAVLTFREPLDPIATDVIERIERLPAVRAVVFDVYGTLVISGSGDVGSADTQSHTSKMLQALQQCDITLSGNDSVGPDALREQIQQLNDQRRSPSCPKPEVDVVEAWRRLLQPKGVSFAGRESTRWVQLASTYEALTNPTWPMPGARDLLSQLGASGIPLGIVSNAQVFTPPLVTDLLPQRNSCSGEQILAGGRFDLNLCVFSNRFRQAKPGPRLFDVLRAGLARRGILPHEAVYVGNDMLNDVWAATQAGLRTAWFAGDARSCRPREDDPRCRSLRPDVILTNLMQLLECVEIT